MASHCLPRAIVRAARGCCRWSARDSLPQTIATGRCACAEPLSWRACSATHKAAPAVVQPGPISRRNQRRLVAVRLAAVFLAGAFFAVVFLAVALAAAFFAGALAATVFLAAGA